MSRGPLRLTGITKVFPDGTRALDGVTLEAEPGEVLTLLGPSGCGKSTLLRIIAGLEHATSGSVELDGRPLDALPPGERDVGFVFQNYALYPHLSVAGNLALALEVQGVSREERTRRVRETAGRLAIGELLARRPAQLSGGQQQRVALGRALVRHPRIYLLDEPLSNLDALLREDMRAELKALFASVGATVVYVTHDQAEAMSLSDRVAVMRGGRVLQWAAPLDLYARPATLFVASFVGGPRMTVWHGEREGGDLVALDVRVPIPAGLAGGRRLAVGIRPEDVVVADQPLRDGLEVRRRLAEPLGARTLLTLEAGGETARALAAPREWPERLWMAWPPGKLHWFDAATEERLELAGGDG